MNDYQKRLQQIAQNNNDLKLLKELLERHQAKESLGGIVEKLERQNSLLKSDNLKYDRSQKTFMYWCKVFHDDWENRVAIQNQWKKDTGEWLAPISGT